MNDSQFCHLVEIEESTRLLKIHRVFPDGRKQLFTETPLPPLQANSDVPQYAEFARKLGENILLDSPSARRVMGL